MWRKGFRTGQKSGDKSENEEKKQEKEKEEEWKDDGIGEAGGNWYPNICSGFSHPVLEFWLNGTCTKYWQAAGLYFFFVFIFIHFLFS